MAAKLAAVAAPEAVSVPVDTSPTVVKFPALAVLLMVSVLPVILVAELSRPTLAAPLMLSELPDTIGHCFVVGDTRHQLRASMSAGWRGSAGQVRRNFRQLSQDNWKNFTVVPPQDNWIFFTVVPPQDHLNFFHSCRLRRQP